jgi:xylan 1,4-beta-xylosidase
MFADTRFGDFPHFIATNKWSTPDELFAGWMLLSYRKPCIATSARYPYAAANVTDENPRTFWLAASSDAGEKITIDLDHPCDVRVVQVNFTDYHSGLFASGPNVYTQFRLHYSLDGKTWNKMADLTDEKRDRPNAYIELKESVPARYIQYEHVHVGSPNLAISDIRIFGYGAGELPATPTGFQVRRDGDARNAFLSWDEVPGTVGYNIRWGIEPKKLYQTYQLFADQNTKLELRALTMGQGYSFAIEAFNERGVSKLSEVVQIK